MTVPKGSICGLLGPNGAGKTSLIRMVNQILLPDSGKIYLDGTLLAPKHNRIVGYLPEERGLYQNMKVGEQAVYLARLKGLSKEEAKQNVSYWFEKFQISEWWHKKTRTLSKGMAQKLQFIIAVVHRPKFLIFDEPFSGFDPLNTALIKSEIRQLRQEGSTVILSTHRMETVEQMCDHAVMLHKSEKVLEGSIKSLQKQFQSGLYEVAIKAVDKEKARAVLSSKYTLLPADFRSLDEDLTFNLRCDEKLPSDQLFRDLLNLGSVSHFVEKIPTMDAIFKKAIA